MRCNKKVDESNDVGSWILLCSMKTFACIFEQEEMELRQVDVTICIELATGKTGCTIIFCKEKNTIYIVSSITKNQGGTGW